MKRRAFILIDLLVVISIVVMLMALLFPVLARARKQARATACKGTIHGWGLMFAAYQSDNDGRFPLGQSWIWDGSGQRETVGVPWPCYLEVYTGFDLRDAMLCPSASKLLPPGTSYDRGSCVAGGATFVAWRYERSWLPSQPSSRTHPEYNGSYGTNSHLCYGGQEGKIKPSARPAFFDSRDCMARLIWANASEPPPFEDAPLIGTPYYYAADVAINRDEGGINMMFFDGAVRKVGVKELWTLPWHEQFNAAGPWTKAGGVKPEDWPAWMRKFKHY